MAILTTIDLETYYDNVYSLSKMTTEEYVRAPLFELIGAAAKFDDTPARWVSGAKAEAALTKMDWSDKVVVAQNCAFDGAILSWRYGVKPLMWCDTLGMSRALFPHEKSHSLAAQAVRAGIGLKGDEVLRALGMRLKDFTPDELERYGHYCENDAELTHKLFTRYMSMGFPKKELRLIDLTLRMFTEPTLLLHKASLELHYREVVERKVELLENVRDEMVKGMDPEHIQLVFSEGLDGIKKMLMSNDKFAAELEKLGVVPPTKISLTTKKTAWAFAKTDEAFKDLQEHEDLRVQALVAARLGNKTTLEETRTGRFIGMSTRGAFPVPLRYYGAHSGRWCLTGDHEVLTPDGWVRLDQWDGQPIRQWDAETKRITWAMTPKVSSFEVYEDVVTFSGKYHNATYTKEHRLPIRKRHTKDAVKDVTAGRMAELAKKELYVSGYAEEDSLGVPADQLRLIVAMHADGYNVQDSKNNMVRFRFTKERKVARLCALLTARGIPYRTARYPSEPKVTVIAIRGADAPEWLRTAKRLPEWFYQLGGTAARVVIDEIAHWDGYGATPTSFGWVGTDEDAAGKYATLAHLCGYRTVVKRIARVRKGWSDAWKISFTQTTTVTEVGANARMVPFAGAVHCPTVPTGYFLCRRSGTTFVTGNSGEQSVNLQNLPSRGPAAGRLKKAILAPEGHVIIDCDSAQIEARVLAWLAGQDDLVHAFRMKEDVYKLMASKIYHVPVAEVTPEQRQVGKTVVLGAGFGVGHAKLQAFLKVQAKVAVDIDEAKRIITTYRESAPKIKGLWDAAGRGLQALILGQSTTIDAAGLIHVVPDRGLTLPNGLFIQYPGLRAQANEEGKREFVYDSKGVPTRIYGGKCLAADTEVLSGRGWVPIADIRDSDVLWDGVEWVTHRGLTAQGYKVTLVLDGVRMTPDHKVQTNKGWVDASSCEGLHRSDFRMPDGRAVRGSGSPFHLGVPVHMRKNMRTESHRRRKILDAWGDLLLRVCSRSKEPDARDVNAPSVRRLEVYERSVSPTNAPSMGELRGQRGTSLLSVGAFLRGILGRHGADVQARVDPRQAQQQRRVFAGELPLGGLQDPSGEPKEFATGGHTESTCDDRDPAVHTVVPVGAEPVYDILNAGPRSRFVVRGATGPFIVHNCVENFVQAVARCVVAEQMLRVAKHYRPVLTVHDAVAIVAPKAQADAARECLEEAMSWNPKWAAGLPLACESGMGDSYGDC